MPNASSVTRPSGPTTAGPTTARVVRIGGLLALAAVVLLFPSLAPDPFILSVGVVILSYAVLATSWNLVGGFTGYISLGHAAYSGLGGYATALLILRSGLNQWLALLV
ncbi:hypothetical protein ACFV9F_26955, partial [Promicromonospora sukumoe]